jgi:type I restriction enzyme S subunit
MSELPEGWTEVSLLEISDFIRGVTYTKSDISETAQEGFMPVLRANNIAQRAFNFDDLVYVSSSCISDSQKVKEGDVVIATSSGSINVVGKAVQAKTDLDAGFGAFCGLLRPSKDLNATYFGHFFATDFYRQSASSMARGVNINNLKPSHFNAISIPLAPIQEQKRIADKLDQLLARVDACRERLDRIPAFLKRFRQAVLAAATSGQLTADWRDSSGCSDEPLPVTLKCMRRTDLMDEGVSLHACSPSPLIRCAHE